MRAGVKSYLKLYKGILLIFTVAVFFIVAMQSTAMAAESQGKAITPATGSAERKQIIDALRLEIEKLHHINAIFVVKYLKVLNGWAWIETLPRSVDGINQYEEVSALLRKNGSQWKVVEIACAEEDNEECLESPGYFKRLKKHFSGVPMAIFPE